MYEYFSPPLSLSLSLFLSLHAESRFRLHKAKPRMKSTYIYHAEVYVWAEASVHKQNSFS
jgi:hypothetical protein